MASIINASTSSGIVQTADTSGVLQLQSNGTTIATISSTGLQQNVGAPTFSYYQSNAQTLSGNTNTKLTFTSSDWDNTSGMYSSSRFTPTVAGYYLVDGALTMASAFCGGEAIIYKNGTAFKSGLGVGGGSVANRFTVSGMVYCNGSTDYIEMYGYITTGQSLTTGTAQTYFQCAMVRSA